jgi:hypothetical protein
MPGYMDQNVINTYYCSDMILQGLTHSGTCDCNTLPPHNYYMQNLPRQEIRALGTEYMRIQIVPGAPGPHSQTPNLETTMKLGSR